MPDKEKEDLNEYYNKEVISSRDRRIQESEIMYQNITFLESQLMEEFENIGLLTKATHLGTIQMLNFIKDAINRIEEMNIVLKRYYVQEADIWKTMN